MLPLGKLNKNSSLSNYHWEKRGLNCFVCIGLAEVSRPGVRKPWVVMVRRAPDETGESHPWGLMPENGGIRMFCSAKEAIKVAEAYLDVFNQYHQRYSDDSIDMSEGNIGVAGAQA